MARSTAPLLNCPDPVLRPGAWGIARVAVDDTAAQLIVTFEEQLTPAQPATPDLPAHLSQTRSYSLTGGQRLFPHITSATLETPPGSINPRVRLQLDGEGDFSIYTLTMSGPDVDPFFASRKLRFRLDCDEPFDCRAPASPPSPVPELPVAIEYLAKDYSSFRQALLDFIPTRLTTWTERSEADIGMMLLELFAATADNLSYMQDRVANEAFLDSATQRRSVASHLQLIGYTLDEGASAYTWLHFQVDEDFNLWAATSPRSGLRVNNNPSRADEPIIVFETLGAATLRKIHNKFPVYNWENQQCCLPGDSLTAALVGSFPYLTVGDYILFADGQGHRDVVRLTSTPRIVPPNQIQADPNNSLTIIQWSKSTPLHYDYCAPNTVAYGNLVVATHGETVSEKPRDLTADQRTAVAQEVAARQPWQPVPRQRLPLSQAPLAHLDPSTLALVAPVATGPGGASVFQTPAILSRTPRSVSTLEVEVEGFPNAYWTEQPSLLNSGPSDQVFRVEIDDAGDATMVFGDNTFGLRPNETATVTATYRVGGGTVGNLGADTLVLPRPRPGETYPILLSVTNPLPAVGGRNLESRQHARRFGPGTFETPLVAVTATDYQLAAQNLTDASGQKRIQRANASFRWTGSWLTVTLAVDPEDSEAVSPELRQAIVSYLNTRRLAGYDLEVRSPVYVSVDLAIAFCVAPGARAAEVQQGLERALSNADLPNGQKGFFHPDNFSFGGNLYVSRLFKAIMAIRGVESARITRLARLWAARPDADTATNLGQGFLSVGVDEIIRLDNDRNFPQRGTLTVQPKGASR